MNLIKKCLISLFALSMLVVVPNNVVFADENDGIMVVGQPISTTSTNVLYGTYSNGFSYGVKFVLSVSFERSNNITKNLVIDSYSAGAFAVGTVMNYSAQVERCYIESSTISGNNVKVVMVAIVSVNNNGSFSNETFRTTFVL